MPIDPNIALGVKPIQLESPLNQLGQALQLQGVQQGNQLNRLKMDEYDRGVARQNQLRTLLGGLGDVPDEKRVSALRTGGYFDEADKLETGLLARQKTGAEVTKLGAEAKAKEFEGLTKKLEVAGSTFGYVMKNPTLDNAMQALDYLGTNGIYTPEQVNQYKTQIQQNPASIGQLAETAFRSVLSAKDQLGKADTVNAGNRQVTQVVDPVTGKVQVSGEMPILQSEQSKAEIKARQDEAARNRAVTMRGQDMTDARQRDANTIKVGEKKSTEDLTKGSQLASFDTMIGTLDRLSAHPGLSKTVGLRSVLPTIPGGDSANFQAELNTFQSQAFIPMVAQLKGMGALSDAEGKKLTQAVGALDPKMGEQAFRDSIARIKTDMDAAYVRVAGKPRADASTKPPASPQDAQALQWANANPKDPRAAQIKQRLGQ